MLRDKTRLDRRSFLAGAGLALGTGAVGGGVVPARAMAPTPIPVADGGMDAFARVREAFVLSPGTVHMSTMLITGHPRPVREAIARHRDGLDADPVTYLEERNTPLAAAAREAAARYLDCAPSQIMLTESTTMGVGLVYNGLHLEPGDEILTTEEDYFVTHEALRVAARRSGARIRRIPLYGAIEDLSEEAIVARIRDAITPDTRLVALTWVHSSTGLKIPAAGIAQAIAEINAARNGHDAVLFGLDGVHGFAIENETLPSLGCDFLMAGCHKWLFGPRGTGIVAASERGLARLAPLVPSFDDDEVFGAWLRGAEPPEPPDGPRLSPGGFKAFEHRWALPEAFAFHEEIGKPAVAERTHALAEALKEGLDSLATVRRVTPRGPALSSGIVSFDVDGLSPEAVVERLRERRIIASVAPYPIRHVRLTPSIRNTFEEIDTCLAAISEIAGTG